MTAIVKMHSCDYVFGASQSLPSNIFGQKPVQEVVKDEVLFSPIYNPNAVRDMVAHKLSTGQNLFSPSTPTKKK